MTQLSATAPKADLLVVDDQYGNIRLLEMSLGRHGYKVRTASSGAEAIEIARNNPPELIMLDISMPNMDGFETCRLLKADRRTYHIPVIFISSLEDVKDKIQAFKSGGVDYVTKPFQFEEVLARIDTHVNIRRLQSALEASNRELANQLDELELTRQAEQEQRELAEALRDTIAAINSTLDYNEVLDLILVHLERVVPHKTANVALIESPNRIQFVRARGYEELTGGTSLIGMRLNSKTMPTWQRILDDPRPLLIPDTFKDPTWVSLKGFDWIRSYACAPIIINGEVIGVLNLESDIPGFFTSEHARRLQTFADQAAVAVEKARLFDDAQRLAITDGLTGIFNRRHLFKLGNREYERVRRYKRQLSAIMIDVDNFKRINDESGHPTGDKVLQDLSKLLRENLRLSDMLGRYGGEEFLILMPETDIQGALDVAERIRQQVEATPMGGPDTSIHFTVSLGVATSGIMETFDDLIRKADQALYAAKASGKNNVQAIIE